MHIRRICFAHKHTHTHLNKNTRKVGCKWVVNCLRLLFAECLNVINIISYLIRGTCQIVCEILYIHMYIQFAQFAYAYDSALFVSFKQEHVLLGLVEAFVYIAETCKWATGVVILFLCSFCEYFNNCYSSCGRLSR